MSNDHQYKVPTHLRNRLHLISKFYFGSVLSPKRNNIERKKMNKTKLRRREKYIKYNGTIICGALEPFGHVSLWSLMTKFDSEKDIYFVFA